MLVYLYQRVLMFKMSCFPEVLRPWRGGKSMIGTPEVIDPAINPEKMEMWGTEIPWWRIWQDLLFNIDTQLQDIL